MARYAYSYDREDYVGAFESPEEAVRAAVAAAEGLSSPPTTIYVGTVVEADPQATDHARQIIEAMNRRAHVDFGEAGAGYLRNVSREQVADLDGAIAQTILAWLRKWQLMPTFVQVRSVREVPVPYPGPFTAPGGDGAEVQQIGPAAESADELTGL